MKNVAVAWKKKRTMDVNISIPLAKGPGNGTLNGSSVKVFKIFCYSFIMVVGTIGNFVIVASILVKKQLKGSELFVLNLTITDLCVCLISVPFDLIEIAMGYWPFGAFLCKVIYPLQTVFMAVSVFTMLCMALERHRAIVKPLKGRKRKKCLAFVMFAVWISCISLVSPYIAVLKAEKQRCLEAWPDTVFVKAYTMCSFLIFYLFPLTIITAAYIHIGVRLRQNLKKFRLILASTRNASFGRKIMDARSRRNLRIVKIFICAVVAFALCLLPFHVMFLWYDFGSGYKWRHFETAKMFAYVLLYTNSMIDPFIFGALTRRCRLCFGCPRHFHDTIQRLTTKNAISKNGLQQGIAANSVQNLISLENRTELQLPKTTFSKSKTADRNNSSQADYVERETSL